MMQAVYIGPENETEIFGLVFPRGQAVEVTDAHAQEKLRWHPLFEVKGDVQPVGISTANPIFTAKRRGRPPKVTTDAI